MKQFHDIKITESKGSVFSGTRKIKTLSITVFEPVTIGQKKLKAISFCEEYNVSFCEGQSVGVVIGQLRRLVEQLCLLEKGETKI